MGPRELKDRAAEAFAKGRFAKAAEHYDRYCAAEPRDFQARLRLGDAWTKVGERSRAVAAYLAAAEGFAREGFLPRAIAASKLVLELDPAHRGVQEMLAGLYARRQGPRPGAAAGLSRSGRFVRAAAPAPQPERASVAPLIPPPPPASAPPGPAPRSLASGGPAVDRSRELPPELDLQVQVPRPPAAPPVEVELELTVTDSVPSAGGAAAGSDARVPAAAAPAVPPGFTPVPPPGLTPRSSTRILIPTPVEPPEAAAQAPEGAAPPRSQRDVQAGMLALSRFTELESDLEELTRNAVFPGAQEVPAPGQGGVAGARAQAPARSDVSEELGASILRTVEMVALAAQGAPLSEGPDEETVFSITGEVEAAPLPGQLPHIPLFSDLAPEAFIALFERCPLRRFGEGQRILQQGSHGDSFFVICEGRVRVVRQDGGQERELAVLEGGAFFGEVALVSDAPRTASVDSAADDTQLLEISAAVLTELSQRYPGVAQALKKFCRERLLRTVMSTSALFRLVSGRDRKALIERFRARDVPRGSVVIREGVESDGFYVVLSGEVVVSREEVTLARLKEGDMFGETSLLRKAPATATVTASRRTSLLRLPREDFDALILSHPQILVHVAELSEDRQRQTAELLAAAASEELMLV